MLTLHLPLSIPSPPLTSGVKVGGVSHTWKVGCPVILDTTYEHETWNEGGERGEEALVLLVDFWHPDMDDDEVDAMREFWRFNSGV
jgi:aspartate beta-hydroxylase